MKKNSKMTKPEDNRGTGPAPDKAISRGDAQSKREQETVSNEIEDTDPPLTEEDLEESGSDIERG